MRVYGIVRIAKSITYQNGVAKFTIAHNDYKKEGHFFNAVAFKGTGEVIFNNCKVGDRIFIDGEILNNNYDKEDGTKIYQNQVVIHRFEFIEKKEQGNQSPPFVLDVSQTAHKRQQALDDVSKSDLPF